MRSLTKKLAVTTAGLVAVAGVTTMGTLALFSDQDSVAGNSFSTGTIALSTSPTSAVVTYSTMMPGDVVTNPLVVSNSGTESLRYAVSSVATNADSKGLKDQLVLTVKTIDATLPATPCDNFDGTSLYTGDLDAAAGKIIGDAAPGQNAAVPPAAADRVLASSASETLCFRVELPLATGNAFQNAATTATFTFDAEQTKNN